MPTADALPTQPLGGTGLSITRLALGTAPMSTFFWNTPAEQGVATAVAAYESGVRMFDTAPLYGLGEAETRLGQAFVHDGRIPHRWTVPGPGDTRLFLVVARPPD